MNKSQCRLDFESKFGEDAAFAIMAAAASHGNGINNKTEPSDEFQWAILIALGYQCLNIYRSDHGIEPEFAELDAWIKTQDSFLDYSGDLDYISFLAGLYQPYVDHWNKLREFPIPEAFLKAFDEKLRGFEDKDE